MNGKDFLKLVWPDQGFYCIATPSTFIDPLTGKPKGMRHAMFDNIDEAYAKAKWDCTSKEVYFGIFTHEVKEPWDPQKKRMWPRRKQDNMDSARCLFLDLDVGTGSRKYATQADALSAIARLVFNTGLPQPICVSSGLGVHVYWPLEDTVKKEVWLPQARNLRLLMDQHKMFYDPSRTTDSSSVLRVPGTKHRKDPDNIRDVKVIVDGDPPWPNVTLFAALSLMTNNLQPLRSAPPVPQGGLPANILPGSFPPTDANDVATECEQVRIMRDSKGNVSQPHWYAVLGLVGYCTNGRKIAHDWSSGHPNYTAAETDGKLDQWQATASATSCAKLGSDGVAGVCQRCPHFGKQWKNPMVIVNKMATLTTNFQQTMATAPAYLGPPVQEPSGYTRTKGMSVTTLDSKGLTVNVTHEIDLYPVSASDGDIEGQHFNDGVSSWVAREYDATGAVIYKEFRVSGEELGDAKMLRKKFLAKALYNLFSTPSVTSYMSAYLTELKKRIGLQPQYTHLGWLSLKDNSTWVMDGRKINAAGAITPCVMSKEAEIATLRLGKSGTLAGQVAALEFFNRPGLEAQQFFIGVALGSPLFKATGHHGVVCHLAGESAAGKTTALKAASGIWGNPTKYILNGTDNGVTTHAREAVMRGLMNYPLCVDEITTMEPRAARALVFSATQNNPREGLKSDRSPRDAKLPGYHSAPILSTGNNSLTQTVNTGTQQAGNAVSARITEITASRATHSHTKDEADAVGRQLMEHHGHIGEAFMTRAMPTMEHLFESVQRMITKLNHDLNVPGIERFYVSLAAPTFVALAYAQYIGLIEWDLDNLYDWFIKTQMPASRDQLQNLNDQIAHENVLRDFLDTHRGAILTVDATGNIPPTLNANTKALAARHETVTRTIWVSSAVFNTWAALKGVNVATMLGSLNAKGIVTKPSSRKHLGAGSSEGGTFSRCFEVDGSHPDLDFK